jgi:hypothetical protein
MAADGTVPARPTSRTARFAPTGGGRGAPAGVPAYGVAVEHAPSGRDRRAAVLAAFFDDGGRLLVMPARRGKRLVVLDQLAQRFEPGRRYRETDVNRLLRPAHDDVAMLRRYLVDEGFLTREEGVYWRSGGTAAM